MFYYILTIKMTSQPLSNFCIELQAAGFVKFDNDCDVIFMFNNKIIFMFNNKVFME